MTPKRLAIVKQLYETWPPGLSPQEIVLALIGEIEQLRSLFCKAHQPTAEDASVPCPCCTALEQADEIGRLTKLVEQRVGDLESGEFSFCETMTPSWALHIRQLTAAGKKLSGGADTKALCGKEVAWDLKVEVEISALHLGHCCQACAESYRRIIDDI